MKHTLYDKIWNDHCIRSNEDKSSLIYIDRHLIHEVTSPQAFDGLDIKKERYGISSQFLQPQITMFQLLTGNMELVILSRGYKLMHSVKIAKNITLNCLI